MHRVERRQPAGFTIVELLIVVVVVGILATVVVVAYSGIRQRGELAAAQAETVQNKKKIELFKVENTLPPGSVTDCPTPAVGNLCLPTDPGDVLSYRSYNAGATTGLPSTGTVLNTPAYELAVLSPGQFYYEGTAEINRASSGNPEFVQYTDMAPIIDKYGPGRKYQISFDIKSASIASASTVNVYMQNGSGARYTFGANVSVTTEYQRRTITVTPTGPNGGHTQSILAFYGTYNTGNIPTVKNVQMQLAP